ncbi:hypothetical protein KEN51_CDS0218 [Pseudomonas phage vB_Pae10145-KEN51]|uniref:PHIKZ169 n=6 Tax=Viruses TaxID=10239 RepID=Q8SCZ3_BPDPK|nr:hypothetical protein [Pseudomonas aeruginosa]NP_803735.1 PHIKZ169 [Pseudomonas phage phiKZ]YP_009617487.1 hypothetical protein FDI90_gp199 [Pseudomonas phage PA7]YP_009619710.1 hypothetical protein FDJ06_gp170 [Pseudomonas phage SL2]ANM44967.1 hypothetical protein KTN4_209 [Pseudomonas phage KTN4]QGK89839.1 hypothetical protein [Pseudomonas phage vB_PA32_GUMS]QJB22845.1 hypothetical protein fnug_202 [Pseudomonas phage fnug]QOV08057.1 hypothetical protein [Pseudomonas phage vB_PaeM_kmuB]Q
MFHGADLSDEPLEKKSSTTEEKVYADLEYEQQIRYTQSVKEKVLKAVLENTTGKVPTDKESVDMILKLTDSMDKTTIANRRIQVDSEGARSNRELAEGFAEFVKMQMNRNPLIRDPNDVPATPREIPDIPDEEFENYTIEEGETEIGIIMEESNAFMERMDAAREKELEND